MDTWEQVDLLKTSECQNSWEKVDIPKSEIQHINPEWYESSEISTPFEMSNYDSAANQ